jgi:MFS family permease
MQVEAGPGRLQAIRGLFGPRRFGRLVATQALSQTADGLYQIALASVLVFSVSAARTPAQVTKLLAVTLIPFSLVGPFTGPFIDRFSRRSILVGASVARAGLTFLLVPAVGWPEPALLGLVVLTMSINRFFHATRSAVLPALVDRAQYLLANTVSTTTGMVFGLAGAVIGGPLADALSPRVVIGGAAVLMVAAATVAATIPLPQGERRGLAGLAAELRDNLRDVVAGLRTIRRRPSATFAISAIWAIRGMLGFILLASLVLLRARFDIRATGASIIFGSIAVGGFAGAVMVPLLARRVGREGVPAVAFLVTGGAILVVGPVPAWPAIVATVFLGGVSMAVTKIAADTIIQTAIPDAFRGRSFAIYDIGYNGVFVLAALVPTALLPALGDVGVIVLGGVLYLAGGVAFGLWRRRLPAPIEVRCYAGGRGDEVPREVILEGIAHGVADIERSWQEERDGERLRCFRLRLSDGRRVQVSLGEEWRLDSVMPGRRTKPGVGQ